MKRNQWFFIVSGIVVLIVTVATITVLGTARAFFARPRTSPTSAPSQPAKIREVSVITVQPNGFEPKEVTHQRDLLLVVDNHSGLPAITLELSLLTDSGVRVPIPLKLKPTDAGNGIAELRVPREVVAFHNQLSLAPGQYLLTEANHKEWSCRLNITR